MEVSMLLNYRKEVAPENHSLVFCKSVHGIFYAAKFVDGEFYPYAHTISDAPIGEVEFWAYQD
jgi:hypothetical protein